MQRIVSECIYTHCIVYTGWEQTPVASKVYSLNGRKLSNVCEFENVLWNNGIFLR